MVAKDFEQIIKEIKIEDEYLIHQKDIPSDLDSLLSKKESKEKPESKIYEINSISEKKEMETSIKATEEPKNEIIPEKEEKSKEKTKKKKKKNNKKKNKKNGKIFEDHKLIHIGIYLISKNLQSLDFKIILFLD